MSKEIEQFVFEPTYRKGEQGLSVLSVDQIPLPDGFVPGAPALLIQIAPKGWGGNHRHQRREVWVGFGDLHLVWRDKNGERHEARMTRDDGKLVAFSVAPEVPHMVENRSDAPAFLYELRDMDDGPAAPLTGQESLRG